MKITGTLRTLSPLTIGAPGDARVDINGRIVYGSNGFPLTRVSRWTVPATADLAEYGFPVIPANSLRGALRRACATHVEDALLARGEQIRLPTYNVLRTGAPFGNPDKLAPSIAEIQAAMAAPPLAIFGGGPRMLRGALRVDTGLPLAQPLAERGLLPAGVRYAEPRQVQNDDGTERVRYPDLTRILWRRRADDLGAFVDPETGAKLIADYRAGVDAWQTLVGAEVEEGDTPSKETKVRGLASLTALEVVMPGVDFTFHLDAETEHQASLGYLLKGVATLLRQQRLGGNGRLGFGRFALDAAVTFDDGHAARLLGPDGALNAADQHVADCVQAADTWLGAVTAADLDAMAASSKDSREDLHGKLKKAGAAAQAALAEVLGA